MDDLTKVVWLDPAESCTADATSGYHLFLCKMLGVPRVWANEMASHVRNRVPAKLKEVLKVDHQFAAGFSP